MFFVCRGCRNLLLVNTQGISDRSYCPRRKTQQLKVSYFGVCCRAHEHVQDLVLLTQHCSFAVYHIPWRTLSSKSFWSFFGLPELVLQCIQRTQKSYWTQLEAICQMMHCARHHFGLFLKSFSGGKKMILLEEKNKKVWVLQWLFLMFQLFSQFLWIPKGIRRSCFSK